MARANGFGNALRGSGPAQPDLAALAAITPRFPSLAAALGSRCDLERAAGPLSVAVQQLGFVWPNGRPIPAQASRRNKKPGAVSRPGMIAYSWIVRFLYEIRVTRVEVKNAECGQVARRPRVGPPCGRRYADALPPYLMIERRKIYRPRSAVRPQPSDSRSWPSNPPPTC